MRLLVSSLIVLLILISGCTTNNLSYQNPFWFYSQEYYMTPETIELSISNIKTGKTTKIEFLDCEAILPGEWLPAPEETHGYTEYRQGDAKFIIWIDTKNKKRVGNCEDIPTLIGGKKIGGPSEPCSTISTTRDFYYKLFFLTLDDYENVKITKANFFDFLMIHEKVNSFRETESLTYYKTNEMEAFDETMTFGRHGIAVFPTNHEPSFSLHTKNVDIETIEYFLSTFRLRRESR